MPTPNRETVAEAYRLIVPSMEWTMQRFAAIDQRIQQATTVLTTLTVMTPIATKAVNTNITFSSCWFWFAVGLGIASIATSIAVQWIWPLRFPQLRPLAASHLHKPPDTFKRDMVHFAGRNQAENIRRIERRARIPLVLSGAIVAEALLFVAWIVGW